MAVIVPPTAPSRKIADTTTELERRIKRVEEGLRATQLANSSLEGSGLNMFDPNGVYRGTLGLQSDGTYATTSLNNPNPPPVPAAAVVVPGIASLSVDHTGETFDGSSWPSDLSHLNVYYADAGIPENKTLAGTIPVLPGSLPIAPLEYTTYLVTVTSVNYSGKESAHSEPSSGLPTQVVSADLISGIIQETHLNAGIVTEAAIKAGAITATKIADGAVETPALAAGSIIASKLAVDSVNSGHITANAITSSELAALAVTAGKIDTNAVTAGTIAAGAVTAAKLQADLVLATRIIAGSATGNRVEIHPTLGLQGYTSGGTVRSFWINSSTGEVTAIGEWSTGVGGEYIRIATDGTFTIYQADGRYTKMENIPNALSMTGPLQSSGRQGGIYLAETGVELNYRNPSGTQVYSNVNVDVSGVDIRGPNPTFRCCEQFVGAPNANIFFGIEDSNRVLLPNSQLGYGKHQNTVGSEATLLNGPFDIGITWASSYIYIKHGDNSPANLAAANVALPSGRDHKRNIRPVTEAGHGRSKEIIKRARASEFEYTFEDPTANPRPERPGTGAWQPTGQLDSQGRDIKEWVPHEWAGPRPRPTKRIGPMAEDLPEEYRMTAVPGDTTGMPWVSLQVIAGLAYDAAADNADDLDALELRIAALEEKFKPKP